MKDTDREENANPREYYIHRWKYLRVNIRAGILHTQNILILTSPIPWPSVSENAYNTFTVGATHLASPSSPFWDSLNPGVWSRRTVRIASDEWQDWRLGRRGCEARSVFVLRLYVSKAALKMARKLEYEVDVEGSVDMKACREARDSRL